MSDRRISLDARLMALAEMVGRCGTAADIGCDHGRLAAFLLQSGWINRCVLTDISEDSLAKARRLLRLIGVENRCDFSVGDGAAALTESVDAAVIAGMGGDTIAGIIRRSNHALDGARLILEANVAQPQLRACLADEGWKLQREALVRDGRRIYVLMEAVRGQMSLDDREALVGPLLLRERPPLFAEYAGFYARVAKKALDGAVSGGDEAQIERLKREWNIWKECL